MKRPSDPSLPTPESKYARQEIPSPSPRMLKHLHTDEVPDFDLDGVHVAARTALASLPDEAHLKRLVSTDVFKENVQKQREQFFQLLRKVLEGPIGVWTLITHDAFWTSPPPPRTDFVLGSESQAWSATEASQHKDPHVVEQLRFQPPSETQIYARYCSIVQSSGMGKSRLLDEFSKGHFLIPMNLRASTDQGYPPADSEVRNFLTRRDGVNSPVSLIQHFLLALFNRTKETLERMDSTKSGRIREFREFMSKDQTMHSPGGGRSEFYDGVIAQARLALKHSSDELDSAELAQALDKLREVLNSGDEEPSTHCVYFGNDPNNHKSCTGPKSDCVDVFITFDEAHTLADSFDDKHTRESRFVVLRRILNSLSSDPLFSFFLSTTGKITQFGQPRGQDASNRINDGSLATPHPYIHLGFDQLMQSRKILVRWTTLDHVVSLECVAHMGRPLWGTRYDHGNEDVLPKLLCGHSRDGNLTNAQIYAHFDINALHNTCLIHQSPLDATRTMHEQIANHMRVCVAVGRGIESLHGIASSEPILSEAASFIMSAKDNRGELLVAAFFTWARDHVISTITPRITREKVCHHFTVKQLFKGLLSESAFLSIFGRLPSQLPFGEVFENANMHFNHVVKPQAKRLLARRFLLYFMARGAAALGTNCQPGIDAVYPYLYNSLDLDVKNVGFIIVQVKNNSSASRSKDAEIFQNMDPFKCGLLDDSDKVNGRFPIPIIRILFSLSINKSEEPSFTQMIQPLFTSYDYVCLGVDPNILRAVDPDPWDSFYNVPVPNVLRSQIPACGNHEAHFISWLSENPFHNT
ncbi:hypothetical protein H4582DRAFT_1901738 [Lactarius indigo]|nr:hypothetical protein H4582DRAFT_1901738 [Lactarius indigo]